MFDIFFVDVANVGHVVDRAGFSPNWYVVMHNENS